jgi:hypothetical protein
MPDTKSPATPDGAGNRRKGGRKRVLLGGKIVYHDGNTALDCTILDVSETGARIRLSRGQGVPSRVYLIDIRSHRAHEVTIAWFKPPLAGLRFEKSYVFDASLPEHLGYLRKIWIEAAVR